jgi:hypothetical protein
MASTNRKAALSARFGILFQEIVEAEASSALVHIVRLYVEQLPARWCTDAGQTVCERLLQVLQHVSDQSAVAEVVSTIMHAFLKHSLDYPPAGFVANSGSLK